jgi:hypothetical protein
LRALREHPGVYLGSYKDSAARMEHEWQEMLDGKGKCIFGLFDKDKIIGLAAVFTSREDSNGQSGVLAMDYIDPLYRGRRLSKLLYQARLIGRNSIGPSSVSSYPIARAMRLRSALISPSDSSLSVRRK